MPGTRVGDAISAIVTALQVDSTVASLATVVDGPRIMGDEPETVIWVGYDGDNEGDYNATENWVQDWAALGAQRRSESFNVVCAAWSWSGDMDVANRRARALAALDAAQMALRGALNIGLGLPQPTIASWVQGQLIQEPVISAVDGTVLGLRARIPFSINVVTRV